MSRELYHAILHNSYKLPAILVIDGNQVPLPSGHDTTIHTKSPVIRVRSGNGRHLNTLVLATRPSEIIKLGGISLSGSWNPSMVGNDDGIYKTTTGYPASVVIKNCTDADICLTTVGNEIRVPAKSFIRYKGRDGWGVAIGVVFKDISGMYQDTTMKSGMSTILYH